MKLEDIISISGKEGLFKIVTRTANGLIVESLEEKKRMPVFASDSVSAFTDISIYTEDDSEPLQNILKSIFEKEKGDKALSPNSSPEELKKYLGEILPKYDRDTVYVSHIKKLLKWYNLLQSLDLIKELVSKEEEQEKGKEAKAKETPKKKKEKPQKDQAKQSKAN